MSQPGLKSPIEGRTAGPAPRKNPTWKASVKRTLDNGLRVVIEERASSPVVALQLWVQAGSADESDAESGLAHVHELVHRELAVEREAQAFADAHPEIGRAPRRERV